MLWLGHRLYTEVNIAVDPQLSVEEGHAVAVEVRQRMIHDLSYLSNAIGMEIRWVHLEQFSTGLRK